MERSDGRSRESGYFAFRPASAEYIAYFNKSHPENLLVDSDLDWGQDRQCLSDTLKRLNVQRIHLDCVYTGAGTELALPAWDGLEPYQPVTR